MCGIVGYIGSRETARVLMDGLKRLEYRGYDSAGIAVFHKGKIEIRRKVGKLAKLEEVIEKETFDGKVGIGHTRWATHGRPSDENAHPHKAGQVTVVGASSPNPVTINGTPGLKLRTQWSSATLIQTSTDNWLLVGDLSA